MCFWGRRGWNQRRWNRKQGAGVHKAGARRASCACRRRVDPTHTRPRLARSPVFELLTAATRGVVESVAVAVVSCRRSNRLDLHRSTCLSLLASSRSQLCFVLQSIDRSIDCSKCSSEMLVPCCCCFLFESKKQEREAPPSERRTRGVRVRLRPLFRALLSLSNRPSRERDAS